MWLLTAPCFSCFCLLLIDSGFDSSVLSEFRTRLVNGAMEQQMLDLMLERFRVRTVLTERSHQRTDATHVVAAVRALNRLECVAATMRRAFASSIKREEDPDAGSSSSHPSPARPSGSVGRSPVCAHSFAVPLHRQ